MNKKFKFTTSSLNNLPKNPSSSRSTELEFSDTEVIGLKCLVGKTGNKRFLLRYIGPKSRKKASIAIARWPDLDLISVRKKARKLKVKIADGIDPKMERDQKLRDRMPTLKEFFYDTFIEMKKQSGKKTWRDDEARFRLCHELHDKPINTITGMDLQQLQTRLLGQKHLRGKQYAPASVDRAVALMKTVLKTAYKLLDIRYIGDKVSLINPDNRRMEYLDVKETAAIIRACRGYPCRVKSNFIALLFLMGCRDKELRTRRWSEISLNEGKMYVPESKNGTSMCVFLSPFMIEFFKELWELKKTGNPYVFPGRKAGTHISQPRVAYKEIKRLAGIENPDIYCFHHARHSLATNLLEADVDLLTVQKILNHKDLSSTQRYIKHSESKIRRSVEVLSSLIEKQAPMLDYKKNI